MIRVITRAALSAVVCLGASALLAGPAHASPAAATTRGAMLSTPAAPTHIDSAATNHSPTISSGPSYTSKHVAAGGTFNCSSGYFCPLVFDPTTNDYKVFFLYHCGRYYLAYWDLDGGYFDEQTGNPTSYFYGQSNNVIKTIHPSSQGTVVDSWYDVWSIRTC